MSSHSNSPEVIRLRGVVQRIYPERGFGFIRNGDSGGDIFFHTTGLDDCQIGELQDGEQVEYEVRSTPKGPRAEHVTRLP
jgi:cold shock protein